jgi:uncharacterized membrane protein YuzA (DUF378 family)
MMLGLGALEWTFMGLLAAMVGLAGVFGLFVVARLVEPRGVKALLRKLAGRPV